MIYIGLGNGNVIENNIDRMAYVNKLSNDKKQVVSLVNSLFSALDSNNIDAVNEQLKELFFEEINTYRVESLINIHSRLDFKSIQMIKSRITLNCINRPTKGFIWNIYNEYNRRNYYCE